MKRMFAVALLVFALSVSGCAHPKMPTASEIPSASSTSSVSLPTPAAASSSESLISPGDEPLKAALKQQTNQKVLYFQGVDIGGNKRAAFAIVADDACSASVWYVVSSGAEKLTDEIQYLDYIMDAPQIWNIDGTILFKCESDWGGSASYSFAWYIRDGKPVNLPDVGMQFSYLGNEQFTAVESDYDRDFTDGVPAGHSYRLYRLYWTKNGLREYGGIEITKEQLLKARGARDIVDTITQAGYAIGTIYYRANGVIDVNYHTGDVKNGTFENLQVFYKDGAVSVEPLYLDEGSSEPEAFTAANWLDFSGGGTYKAAFFPEIATYPKKFPLN